MKKIPVFFLLFLSVFTCAYSQQGLKTGEIELDELSGEDWFRQGVQNYTPDKKYIKRLETLLDGHQIVVFAGTWCPDTRSLLPKFSKVINATGFNQDDLQVFLVDYSKTTPGGEASKYDIHAVPTFIILKDGKEIGRITERVDKSIEADLYKILK